jgi:hypothetical protein
MGVSPSLAPERYLMAQVTNVKLLDDLDGTKAAETVVFGMDGALYEIDLSARNAKALRKALSVFVDAGRERRPTPSPVTPGRARSRPAGPNAAVIRKWAHENDVQVSVRGRVSGHVRAQYLAATGE